MDREEFMSIVYDELYSDGDNNRANRIIDAADEYAESAQFGTDCISRRAAIESISKLFHPIGGSVLDEDDNKRYDEGVDDALQEIEELPSLQLGTNLVEVDTDCISRRAVIDIALQYCPDDDGVCSKAGHDPREMLDEIEALPSAQPKPCNYVNACNELAMNNTSSTYGYLQILKEFEKYGYILVDAMGNMR